MKKLLLILCLFIGLAGSFEVLHATEVVPNECIAYYGEISPKTGRPKTKHVRSYIRKDGTYVKDYYRS